MIYLGTNDTIFQQINYDKILLIQSHEQYCIKFYQTEFLIYG